MTLEAIFTLALFAATLVILGTQRLRPDLTALLVMLLLVLSGILTPEETFAAFNQPVLIIVAGIFVLGAALTDTGVATFIASRLMGFARRGPLVLLLIVMLTAGLISSVLGSLMVTGLLMPAVLRLTRRVGLSPALLLLPLATAATVGNQFTLIGTPPNLVVNDLLVSSGAPSLSFFEMALPTALSLGAAILWFALVGRHLLRREAEEVAEPPSLEEVEESYELATRLYRVRVRRGSSLVGEKLIGSGLRREFRLSVVAVQPAGGKLLPPTREHVLEPDDLLIVEGERGDVFQAASLLMLEPKGEVRLEEIGTVDRESLRLAEVIVPFRSELVGKTLAEVDFQGRYGLNVVAIHHQGQIIRESLPKWKLRAGDTMLVEGPRVRVEQVGQDWSLVTVGDLGPQPGDEVTGKARLAVGILAAMVLLVALNLLPLAVASLAAIVALLLTGMVSLPRAYGSIDGSLLVLIGGMFPLAMALEQTGAAAVVARLIGSAGPLLGQAGTLLLLYAATALVTQIVSNSVTAALMMPIALQLAQTQGLAPHTLAIAVAFAVNGAYALPLTDANNLLVREPGQYEMRDYLLNTLPLFVVQSVVVLVILV